MVWLLRCIGRPIPKLMLPKRLILIAPWLEPLNTLRTIKKTLCSALRLQVAQQAYSGSTNNPFITPTMAPVPQLPLPLFWLAPAFVASNL